MPKDKIDSGVAEQDKLKNTVWEKFNEIAERFGNLPEDLFATEEAKASRQKLQDDLEVLSGQMKEQYTRRNQMGNTLPMTVEAYHALQQQFETCLKDSRALSEELKQNADVRALKSFLVRGRNALTALPENHLPSFAEAASSLMPSTIRLVNVDMERKQGAMSSRMVVSYTDEAGKVHEGFLTMEEAPLKSIRQELGALREKFIQKYPDSAEAIGHAFADNKFLNAMKGADDEEQRYQFYKTKPAWINELEPAHKKEIYTELSSELFSLLNRGLIMRDAGIAPGSKVAQRNSAMSDVARQLGFPNLLAEGRRVIIEKDGNQISGVMMETADIDTIDNANMNEDSPFMKLEGEEFDSEATLRSLADLQVLDFLCGNTDRHAGNFFTRFDVSNPYAPRILGVQGIDNDTSFGTITNGIQSLAKLDNLKIVTPEMAKAIESLSAEDFGELLDEYDLSKKEKEAAQTRLSSLKEYIGKGKEAGEIKFARTKEGFKLHVPQGEVRIVKPGEWSVLTLDSLISAKPGQGNIFTQMGKQREMQELWKNQNRTTELDKLKYTSQDADESLKTIRETLEAEYENVRKMKALLTGKCKEEKGGHTAFTNLAEAVNFLDRQYEKILRETSYVRTMDDDTIGKLDAFYKALADDRKKIADCASVYKSSHILPVSPSGRARMQLANRLDAFIKPQQQKSQSLYEKGKQEIKLAMQAEAGKTAYEESAHASNKMLSLMENTIKRNMEKHSRSGATYALGVRALEAQKRLWNFSQSQEVEQPSKKDGDRESAMNEDGREQLSFHELVQAAPQVRKDVSADVQTILAFVGKQKSSAKKEILNCMQNGEVQALSNSATKTSILRGQNQNIKMDPKSMTPQEARRFLGMVFAQEAKIANIGTEKKKAAPTKQHGKGL